MVGASVDVAVAWVFDLPNQLFNLLFPPHCVICNCGGAWLCADCQEQFAPVGPPVCECCGDPVASGRLCLRCQAKPLAIDGVRSVYQFEGTLRDTLHEFKYNGMKILAHPLGRLMGDYVRLNPVSVDVVVPVPLHRRRLRQRGYNQSALLAREVARGHGLPMDTMSLVRQRETAPQVSLGASERRTNVQGAFVCITGALREKNVLLIDDVCTTGSTLEACAAALYQAGVVSVHALTLARAVTV